LLWWCVVVLWLCGVVVLWCCGVVVLWCCGVVVLWCAIVYMHACELTRARCSYGRMSIGGRQLRWQYVESASGDVVDEFVLTK